jgi:hypothetical protein
VELFKLSRIETVKLPEVVDLVFPASMEGTSGAVYTDTESRVAMEFPVGLVSRIYKEYTFATKGIEAFPVLLIVNV